MWRRRRDDGGLPRRIPQRRAAGLANVVSYARARAGETESETPDAPRPHARHPSRWLEAGMHAVQYRWNAGGRDQEVELVHVEGTRGRPYRFGDPAAPRLVEVRDF